MLFYKPYRNPPLWLKIAQFLISSLFLASVCFKTYWFHVKCSLITGFLLIFLGSDYYLNRGVGTYSQLEGSMSSGDCALGRTADGLQISAFHQQKWIWIHQFYSLLPNWGSSVYADLSKYYIKHLDEWVKLI